MNYEKTEWKNRQGTGLNRFRITVETGDTVYLTNEPEAITDTQNMGGYIVGGDDNDPPEVIRPLLNGKGKINIEEIVNALFDKEHPVGVTKMKKEKGKRGRGE